MPATDNLRYERKLLPMGRGLPEVLALIDQHPAGFREVYPPRMVNNLYLDSPALDDYHQHVNGLPVRSKCRIRWYGPLRGPIETPTFERKFKRGAVSGKRACGLPPLALNGGINDRRLREMLERNPPKDSLRVELDHRSPTLITRYRRHYFLSADGRVRLTVDSELRFFPPEHTDESMASPPPRECAIVIELKYAPEHAEEAAAVARRFAFRVARCSKYVLGIEALDRA